MIVRLCQTNNIPLINVVRREEQVKILKEEYNCEHVLNQTDPDFSEQLKSIAKELKATVLLECIGGEMTASVLEQMPSRSTCILYGSFREVGLENFDALTMIGRSYTIDSFILGEYLKDKGLTGILPVINKVTALMSDETLQSNIQKRLKFSEFKDGIADYYKNMTAGKFVLCPHEADPELEQATEESPIF